MDLIYIICGDGWPQSVCLSRKGCQSYCHHFPYCGDCPLYLLLMKNTVTAALVSRWKLHNKMGFLSIVNMERGEDAIDRNKSCTGSRRTHIQEYCDYSLRRRCWRSFTMPSIRFVPFHAGTSTTACFSNSNFYTVEYSSLWANQDLSLFGAQEHVFFLLVVKLVSTYT